MKIDLDDNMQNTVTNTIALIGLVIIVVASFSWLGAGAKEIALSLGGGIVGFLGRAKLATTKTAQPAEKPQSNTVR